MAPWHIRLELCSSFGIKSMPSLKAYREFGKCVRNFLGFFSLSLLYDSFETVKLQMQLAFQDGFYIRQTMSVNGFGWYFCNTCWAVRSVWIYCWLLWAFRFLGGWMEKSVPNICITHSSWCKFCHEYLSQRQFHSLSFSISFLYCKKINALDCHGIKTHLLVMCAKPAIRLYPVEILSCLFYSSYRCANIIARSIKCTMNYWIARITAIKMQIISSICPK